MPDPVETTPSDTRLDGLYRQGMSVRAIAAAEHLSAKTVHRRLTAAGVQLRPSGGRAGAKPPRPLAEQEIQAVAAEYLTSAVSLEVLGARYERTGGAIARLLRGQGIEVRPRGRTLAAGPGPQIPDDLLAFHEQGLRPAEIAAHAAGAQPVQIARALRNAGVTPHRGRPLPGGAELAAAYATAGSVRALARRLHADEQRIREALAAAGLPPGSLRRIQPGRRGKAAQCAAVDSPDRQFAVSAGSGQAKVPLIGRAAGDAARACGTA